MKLLFKKDYSEGIYSYHYVTGHQCDGDPECKGEFEKKYRRINFEEDKSLATFFTFNLSFASFLLSRLDKYALLKYSPALNAQPFIAGREFVNWKYEVLANDFDGFGVDKGFIPVQELTYCLTHLTGSVVKISEIPEDTFGETCSGISIFGLKEQRKTELTSFLQNSKIPLLQNILLPGELFIHIVYGKEFGFFNSFLIKAVKDLQETISEFENLVNAGN